MYPPLKNKLYNYVGRPRVDGEVTILTAEEQDDYVTSVLKENSHKKELIDFSNPTRKLKITMDTVQRARNKTRVIREQLRMHKLDFIIRTKLPPKTNLNTRYREENLLRDARRTLNWLYEVADEEEVDVSDIADPVPHFKHTVELFVSGEYVFDLRDTKLVRAAYEDCFDGCAVMLRQKRVEELAGLESSIAQASSSLGKEPNFDEMGRFIMGASPTGPSKDENQLPPPPYVSSSYATPNDVLNESMMVDQDNTYETPKNKKKLAYSKAFSPPQPPATPSKWMSKESLDRASKSKASRVPAPAPPPKRHSSSVPSSNHASNRASLSIGRLRPVTPNPNVTVIKKETTVNLAGYAFKMTTETTFEKINAAWARDYDPNMDK